MTRVVIERDTENRILGFEAFGHASNRIVCAGISTITQGIVEGLVVVLNLSPKVTKDDEKGYLCCKMPYANYLTEILFKTMYLTLLEIQIQYPNDLQIIEE